MPLDGLEDCDLPDFLLPLCVFRFTDPDLADPDRLARESIGDRWFWKRTAAADFRPRSEKLELPVTLGATSSGEEG